MPMWRCPHCGTPQAEAARCWVCKRSSTSCGTCRHFRRAIAGQLGYCGLDRFRRPLRGDELRGCWEAAAIVEPEPAGARRAHAPASAPITDARPRIEFVELDFVRPTSEKRAPRTPTAEPTGTAAPGSTPARDPVLGFWAEEA
jgi:hypothetical protein